MRKCPIVLFLLTVPLAFPSSAAAWSYNGHMAVSRIAWKQLTDKQIIAVSKLLKAHPHYDIYLAADRPQGLTEPEWVFARASTWSDWVRGPSGPGTDAKTREEIKKKFHKGVWHYVDLPYIHPNDVAKFDEAAIRKEILEPEFDKQGEPRHALAALKLCMKKLTAAETPDADKAVYLTWLFHLVGDLHQPLHCVALIASKDTYATGFFPPDGDRGGNQLAVKGKAGDNRYVNLHAYWDGLLFNGGAGLPTVDAVVAKLVKDPQYQRNQLAELKSTEFLAWAEEGLELCKKVVYKGDGGFLKAYPLPLKGGKPNVADVPVLPENYQKEAETVAARRMMIAGYRLSDQLAIALKEANGAEKTPEALAVTAVEAFICTDPPQLKPTGLRVPYGTLVSALEEQVNAGKTYVKVKELSGKGKVFGWIAKSNLGSQKEFDVTMKPDDPINVDKLTGLDLKMACLFNVRGKYLQEKAKLLEVDASALAAVLQVESSGRGFSNDGRMTVRFENHIFQRYWGASHKAEFDKFFKFDAKVTWKGHQWRKDPEGEWQPCHKNQAQEWETFNFAQTLDEKAARMSVSYGTGQVMGFNHKTIGCKDVNEMFDKMSEGIKPQLDAMVSFIRAHPKCMEGLKSKDYVLFASCYNGTINAATYGASIKTAAESYEKVTKR